MATVADFTACGYAWQPVGGTSWSSTCSDHATATRRYICQRQDGEQVDAAKCDASHRETETEIVANLTNCSYAVTKWEVGSYSSTCSSSAVRKSQAAECVRSGNGEDPVSVPIGYCASAGLETSRTETVPIYDGCTYTPTYSTSYSACTNGTQSAPIASCMRSDNVKVPNIECGATKQTVNRPCTSYVCGAFKTGGHVSGTSVTLGVNVPTNAAAAALCQAHAAGKGVEGACLVESVSQYHVYFVAGKTSKDAIYATYFYQNVAFCTRQ